MSANSRVGGSLNESRLTPTPPSHGTLNNNRGWSASCLRPAPPLSPCLALGSTPNGPPFRINRKSTMYKEDALILEVIEAYCSTGRNRSTADSGRCNSQFVAEITSEHCNSCNRETRTKTYIQLHDIIILFYFIFFLTNTVCILDA